MKTRIGRLIAQFLALALCVGLLAAVPVHAETGLLGDSFEIGPVSISSAYPHTIGMQGVKTYEWPSSGYVFLLVTDLYPISGLNGVTIPPNLVVDAYLYHSDNTYTFIRRFDTTDGKSLTVADADKAAGFKDVPSTAYYAKAVEWAKENGITTGTGDGTQFSPNLSCTRAQAMTFLWRAAGCPEPKTAASPFSDVTDPSAYYYKPVLWAAEEKVTVGNGSGKFDIDGTLAYDQILTFLCRNAGQDASGSDWSAAAVAWAKERGISEGLSFSPKANCPRSAMVTFLYRQLGVQKVPAGLSDEEGAKAAILNGLLEKQTVISFGSYNIQAADVERLAREIADKDGENPYNIITLGCTRQAGGRALDLRVSYGGEKLTVYYESAEEIKELAREVAQKVVTPGMSEYEIAKALHDWLVLNCCYDMRLYSGGMPYDSYTAYGPLKYGTSVCAGYAKAYQALLEVSGLECEYVTGMTTQGYHGWNVVRIDGEWYHVDTTWDDPIPDCEGYIRYKYFLKSDNYMLKDHGPWSTKKACTSTKYDPVIPSTDEQRLAEEKRKREEKEDAACRELIKEIAQLCYKAIEGNTDGKTSLRIEYDQRNIPLRDYNAYKPVLNAALQEKYPDWEVAAFIHRTVYIETQKQNPEQDTQKPDPEQDTQKQDQPQDTQKQEWDEKEAATQAHILEIEKLLQDALVNAIQRNYSVNAYGYTQKEVKAAIAKMEADGYAFGDFTSADYTMRCVSIKVDVRISEEKWAQILQMRQEQRKLEEERQKEEQIESLVEYFFNAIEKPSPEDLETMTRDDIYQKISDPKDVSLILADTRLEVVKRLQAKVDPVYPGYKVTTAHSGIFVYRADVEEAVNRRQAEGSAACAAEPEERVQQPGVPAG